MFAPGFDTEDRRLRVPVIPDRLVAAGEHAINGGGTLVEDGCDEQRGAKHELAICSRESRFVGELPGEGAHDGIALGMGGPEQRVQVRKQAVADMHGLPACVADASPQVRFLACGAQGVVVTVEGEERAELHPAVAQFFVRVGGEAARVGAEQRDSKDGEGEGLRNGEEHVGPFRDVVTAPVASPFSTTGESRPAYDQWTFAWENSKEGLVRGIQDLVPKEVVNVVFFDSVRMCGIGRYGMYGKISLDIFDGIGRPINISNTQCWARPIVRGARA